MAARGQKSKVHVEEEEEMDEEEDAVDPLRSPLRTEFDDDDQVEVMELADPSGYLSSGTPLVFTIPSIHQFNMTPTATSSQSEGETEVKPKGHPGKKFNWIAYPSPVINKLNVDSDWSNQSHGEKQKNTHKGYEEDSLPSSPSKIVGDEDEAGWETMSEGSDEEPDEGEWEEEIIYVELDDLPSVQELFAKEPDDFLRFQHRKVRHKTQPVKATYPKLNFQFHQFHTDQPILQIGTRYFSGAWEQPTGSALFFREKNPKPEKEESSRSRGQSSSSSLKNLVPDPKIEYDSVFGASSLKGSESYELICKADRVLKTKSLESGHSDMYKIPRNAGTYLGKLPPFKVPKGYTLKDILGGKYLPHNKTKGKIRRRRGVKRTSEGKISAKTMKIPKRAPPPKGTAIIEMITPESISTSDVDEEQDLEPVDPYPDVEVIAKEASFLTISSEKVRRKRK